MKSRERERKTNRHAIENVIFYISTIWKKMKPTINGKSIKTGEPADEEEEKSQTQNEDTKQKTNGSHTVHKYRHA